MNPTKPLAALTPAELKKYRTQLVTIRSRIVGKARAIDKVLNRVAARLDQHYAVAA